MLLLLSAVEMLLITRRTIRAGFKEHLKTILVGAEVSDGEVAAAERRKQLSVKARFGI